MTRRHYRGFITDSARWDGHAPRPGDVIVTTPPKCGTTWMQMCCLVLIHGPTLPAPLSVLSPWYDQTLHAADDVEARLAAQDHRRVIKTHTPLDGIPQHPGVTYVGVGRDPRDVALSLANHAANMDLDVAIAARAGAGAAEAPPRAARPREPVALLLHTVEDRSPVEDFTSSLQYLVCHLRQLWDRRDDPTVALFHYRDMRADLEGEMRRLADALGISVDEDRWPELVGAATFESMKANADELAPNADKALWHSNESFFAEGRLGGWRGVVPDEVLARYDERLLELSDDPAFTTWLHEGRGIV